MRERKRERERERERHDREGKTVGLENVFVRQRELGCSCEYMQLIYWCATEFV